MDLFDYMKVVLIFSVVVSGLNATGLFTVEVDTLPGAEYADMNESVAQIIAVEGGGNEVIAGDSVNILTQASTLTRIFLGAMAGLIYLYGPLVNMGMSVMIAAIFQAVLTLYEVAFLVQFITGRYWKSMDA
jgi:hypothetical protein